jgi:hypothetical protein
MTARTKGPRKPTPAQNSAPEPSQARGRPFPKGTSGNPGGRPKAVRELLEVARSAVPRALAFATKLLDDTKAEARVRLDAAKFVCAYGLGAPPRLPLEDGDDGAEPLRPLFDSATIQELHFIARGGLRRELEAQGRLVRSEVDEDGEPQATPDNSRRKAAESAALETLARGEPMPDLPPERPEPH